MTQANGFADAIPVTSGTWELNRNGLTFTVQANACLVDDPRDGQDAHDPAEGYCADSPPGTGDSNGDDYRRVTLERRNGRWLKRPPHYRKESCSLLTGLAR